MPEVESHSYLVRRSQSSLWNVSAVNRTPWGKVLRGRRGKKRAFISTSCFHSVEIGMVRGAAMRLGAAMRRWSQGELGMRGGRQRKGGGGDALRDVWCGRGSDIQGRLDPHRWRISPSLGWSLRMKRHHHRTAVRCEADCGAVRKAAEW